MKHLMLILVVIISSSVSLAKKESGKAVCVGTKEASELFGPVEITLASGKSSDYVLTLEIDGNVFVKKAVCDISEKATGVRGVLALECTDEQGSTIPVRHDLLNNTLVAEFHAAGGFSYPLETVCNK